MFCHFQIKLKTNLKILSEFLFTFALHFEFGERQNTRQQEHIKKKKF